MTFLEPFLNAVYLLVSVVNSELQRDFPLAVSTARLAGGTPGPGLAGAWLGVGSGGEGLAEVALLPRRARRSSSSCACCSYADVCKVLHTLKLHLQEGYFVPRRNKGFLETWG